MNPEQWFSLFIIFLGLFVIAKDIRSKRKKEKIDTKTLSLESQFYAFIFRFIPLWFFGFMIIAFGIFLLSRS